MKPYRRGLKKYRRAAGMCFAVFAFFSCACGRRTKEVSEELLEEQSEKQSEEQSEEQWEEARTTPLGKYPELVTYTLAKISIDNVDGSVEIAHEDNAYTQYLRRILNVQNENVIESNNLSEYTRKLTMMVSNGEELPDVMHITDKNLLETLVEKDLLEDLSLVYEQCASDLIKDMYSSYGEDFLKEYTYDGKLIGFPNTELDDGVSLLWLRKDWMEELGLDDPETPEDAYEIIKTFAQTNPGSSPNGNAGLCFSLSEGNFYTPSFSIQPIFGLSYAYPGIWIPDENGNIVYGSIDEKTKEALAVIRDLYRNGVLDPSFMLRTPQNIQEMINSGACGAVFGAWSLPYGYLQISRENQGADWQPYLLCNEDGYVTSPVRYSKISCVAVRKGYEHPEIVPKILTVIYDYSRNEGAEGAEEVNAYNRASGRWEAMPLVIDVNYKDSLQQNTRMIKEVLKGERAYEDTSLYVRDMADKCINYLNKKNASVNEWVTYTARIRAVDELNRVEIRFVNEDYPELRNIDVPKALMKLEKEFFIKIITGEQELDSFDDFVEQWYQNGGEELTEKANRTQDKSDGGKEEE